MSGCKITVHSFGMCLDSPMPTAFYLYICSVRYKAMLLASLRKFEGRFSEIIMVLRAVLQAAGFDTKKHNPGSTKITTFTQRYSTDKKM